MIEGLKVTINGPELVKLCTDRATHHENRAATYARQIDSMKEDAVEGMQYTNGDPVKNLEGRMSHHQRESSELTFIAKHIDKSEQYLLERQDLEKLGICKSRY